MVVQPSLPKKQVFDLATCRFLREHRDALLIGPPGTGKSFVAQAVGYQAIKQGFTVLYRSVFDVVRDFLHEEVLGEDDKVLTRYLKPDLVIVDDMGMKQLPRRSGEVLFEIVMRRYETRSTMMTSNRPLEDWGKLLGDVPSATRHSRPLPAPRRSADLQRQELPPAETTTPRQCGRRIAKCSHCADRVGGCRRPHESSFVPEKSEASSGSCLPTVTIRRIIHPLAGWF